MKDFESEDALKLRRYAIPDTAATYMYTWVAKIHDLPVMSCISDTEFFILEQH